MIAASQRVPGASIRALSRVGCRTLALGDDLQQRVPKQKSGSMEVERERLQLLVQQRLDSLEGVQLVQPGDCPASLPRTLAGSQQQA